MRTWLHLFDKAHGHLTVAVLSAFLAAAQTTAQPSDAAPTETDALAEPAAVAMPSEEELHDGLRELRATMEKAINERDIDTLVDRASEAVVFTTMNGDVVHGRDGVRTYFEEMMSGPEAVVKSVATHFQPDGLSVLYGDKTAVAYGHTDDHYELTSGQSFDVQAMWSGTMRRDDDGLWRVASFHYSTNMFDNPILSAQRRLLTLAGIAVAVVLAGLGFFLGRRSARRATP